VYGRNALGEEGAGHWGRLAKFVVVDYSRIPAMQLLPR